MMMCFLIVLMGLDVSRRIAYSLDSDSLIKFYKLNGYLPV